MMLLKTERDVRIRMQPTLRRRLFLWSAMIVLGTTGCQKYGTVGPTAYEYAKALFSITNRQRSEKLDSVADQITTAAEEGKLTAVEHRWLIAIVDDARAGKWDKANQASRRMMEEQINEPREQTVEPYPSGLRPGEDL